MKKFFIITTFSIFLCITLKLIFVVLNDDKDICLDSGICVENLKINTEYGEILINKETCLKYNWVWNNEKTYCILK